MGSLEALLAGWASSQPGSPPQLVASQATSQSPNGVALNANAETKSLGSAGDGFAAIDEGEDSDVNVDKKWVLNPQPKPRKKSQKRRADTAAFELWIEQNQTSLCKRARKLVIQDGYSTQALVQDFETKRIIASPREYQLELFERAKTKNTIAVLDTGTPLFYTAVVLGISSWWGYTVGSGTCIDGVPRLTGEFPRFRKDVDRCIAVALDPGE